MAIRQADGDNQVTFRWRRIEKQTTEFTISTTDIKTMQFYIFRKVA